MSKSHSASYAAAGVDIEAGYKAVELMKTHIARTLTSGVCSDVGGFGGLFELDVKGMERPVLVSGTDGVGTKLKLAFLMDKHDTVGIDCVAMCVNDIICCGAKPLFFLDYIACGKNEPERIAQIVSGVAEGCVQSGAALIGGETAEMPGFYPVDEYDLAGFSVGVVDKCKVLDNSAMRPGDVVRAASGDTVEIQNTDAEGRLALCDALDYAQKQWTPAAVVDIATLTGACAVALGTQVAGLFCDDDALAEHIRAAGAVGGENYWPLPLWKGYEDNLKSEVADICHMGPREGGAIHAALFLKHFVREGVRWAHLDIAGVDWATKKTALCPVGSTGFGARTLLELARGGV